MKTPSILALGNNKTLAMFAACCRKQNLCVYLFNPLDIRPIDWQQNNTRNDCTGNHTPNNTIDWQTINKIIVISTPAAEYGVKTILHKLPTFIDFFSIGPQTAEHLQAFGIKTVQYPALHHSEALLELKALQNVEKQNIVIFKGCAGRTFLQESLTQRGALVHTIDCYQRTPARVDLSKQLFFWQEHNVQQLLASSQESLDAFSAQVPKAWQTWLKQLTLVVTSARLAECVRDLGFKKIISTTHFSSDALCSLLLNK